MASRLIPALDLRKKLSRFRCSVLSKSLRHRSSIQVLLFSERVMLVEVARKTGFTGIKSISSRTCVFGSIGTASRQVQRVFEVSSGQVGIAGPAFERSHNRPGLLIRTTEGAAWFEHHHGPTSHSSGLAIKSHGQPLNSSVGPS